MVTGKKTVRNQKTVPMPPDMLEAIAILAEEKNIPEVDIIRKAVAEYLERNVSAICPVCGMMNHEKAKYCSECGAKFEQEVRNELETLKYLLKKHADIVKPLLEDPDD
jgi:ribosomal protein L37E